MSGSSYGQVFKISTFGESHGKAVGVIIDGVPPGIEITEEEIQVEMNRRKPGQSDVTTPRSEADQIHILSGTFEGKTTGTPISIILYNQDQRSGDYGNIKDLFRPGHADFTYNHKYGIRDYRGSGRASGRETAGRVAAGALARKILKSRGIEITAFTKRAAGISCETVDVSVIEKNPMRTADLKAAEKMVERVKKLAEEGNSTGGIVECRVNGLPPGLGEPVFDKLDAEIAKGMLSLGAVKGIEFGAGFAAADMSGKEHNDWMNESGFMTNNAGGVLGGISTGNTLEFRIVVKPTSSISVPQKSIDKNGREVEVITEGRHDPCICPRIIPVVESMTAIILLDLMMIQNTKSL